jgi:hypothetical protein
MQAAHWQGVWFQKQIALDAEKEHHEHLKAKAKKQTFMDTAQSLVREAEGIDPSAALEIESPIRPKVCRDWLTKKLESMYLSMVDAVIAEVELDRSKQAEPDEEVDATIADEDPTTLLTSLVTSIVEARGHDEADVGMDTSDGKSVAVLGQQFINLLKKGNGQSPDGGRGYNSSSSNSAAKTEWMNNKKKTEEWWQPQGKGKGNDAQKGAQKGAPKDKLFPWMKKQDPKAAAAKGWTWDKVKYQWVETVVPTSAPKGPKGPKGAKGKDKGKGKKGGKGGGKGHAEKKH